MSSLSSSSGDNGSFPMHQSCILRQDAPARAKIRPPGAAASRRADPVGLYERVCPLVPVYSTLLSDSTISIFFMFQYIMALTATAKANVMPELIRKLFSEMTRPNIIRSTSTVWMVN